MSGGSTSGGAATGGEQNGAGGDTSSGGAAAGGGTGGDGAGGDGSGGAGTGGAGTGGTTGSALCEDYCNAWFQKACDDAGGEAYSEQSTCMTACASMTEGTPGASSGDTIACRITHLGLAAQMDAAHCGHAQENSTGNCVD